MHYTYAPVHPLWSVRYAHEKRQRACKRAHSARYDVCPNVMWFDLGARRWHKQADMTGNLDAVALLRGYDLSVHFHATGDLG